MPLARAPLCPKCGKRAGVRLIQYGMPAQLPDETKYAIGGCSVSPDGNDPEWRCVGCGLEWGIAAVIQTPIGRIAWRGRLEEATMLTMPDGKQVRFYSLISMTNGACFDWFAGRD